MKQFKFYHDACALIPRSASSLLGTTHHKNDGQQVALRCNIGNGQWPPGHQAFGY